VWRRTRRGHDARAVCARRLPGREQVDRADPLRHLRRLALPRTSAPLAYRGVQQQQTEQQLDDADGLRRTAARRIVLAAGQHEHDRPHEREPEHISHCERGAVGRSAVSSRSTGLGSLPEPIRATKDCYVDRTRVVVDNTKGAEAQFASNLRAALSAAGFEVEVREPLPQALYDTTVHFVVEGVSVRVPQEFAQHDLKIVAAAVRDAEARRRDERRRVRAVAIYQGETSRVLAWVDVFASDGL
jgi:hypothetical protein